MDLSSNNQVTSLMARAGGNNIQARLVRVICTSKKWVQELQRQGNPKLIMFLVVNKVDLEDKERSGK